MAGKAKILVVDDEPDIVKVVSKLLEVNGFSVLVAMDGQGALEQARTQHPDLMILDLMLPKLNGYEVCTMLKQDARYRQTPIVMFTAKTQEKDEALGYQCGADAYVRKPFDGQDLLGHVQRLLATAASGGGTARPGQGH